MNIHRNVIYKRRQKFLKSEDHKEEIEIMIKESAENIVRNYTEARPVKEWNYQENTTRRVFISNTKGLG